MNEQLMQEFQHLSSREYTLKTGDVANPLVADKIYASLFAGKSLSFDILYSHVCTCFIDPTKEQLLEEFYNLCYRSYALNTNYSLLQVLN